MSSFELYSHRHEDPYGVAVRGFLKILFERFPITEEISSVSLAVEEAQDSLSSSVEAVQMSCSRLFELALQSSVPLRDKHLLDLSFRKTESLASVLYGPAGAVEKAFHEAYLDSTEDERSELLLLAELRDQVFYSEANPSTVKNFLELFEGFMENRKTRGWPSWRNLETHRTILVGTCESLVNS